MEGAREAWKYHYTEAVRWRDDAGSERGCGSQGPEMVHLKMGKGVSSPGG